MEVQGAHTRPVGLSGVLPEVRLTLPGWPRRGGRTGAVNVTGCQSPASVLTALELQKRQILPRGRQTRATAQRLGSAVERLGF